MEKIKEIEMLLKNMSVNEMVALKNKIMATINYEHRVRLKENIKVLEEEIANLLDGVGKGFRNGDCYAQTRYYSNITGIKNLRLIDAKERENKRPCILAKVTSPAGYLLPKTIQVRQILYDVAIVESSTYNDEVDY